MRTEPIAADAEARAFATDPRCNVVLEASAGTGKTSVLVDRYVNLLRAGVDPSHVLAITFTRKAAAEMRERIVAKLRASTVHSDVERARWRELRDRLGDITISTIDAFCLALVREFPLEADVDPGFGIADQTEVPRLLDYAVDQGLGRCIALARTDADIALVLAHLGVRRAKAGLAHLLERRLTAPVALARFVARVPDTLTAGEVCTASLELLCDLLRSGPGGLAGFIDDGPLLHRRFAMLANDLARADELKRDTAAARGIIDRLRDHFLTQTGAPRQRLGPLYQPTHFATTQAAARHRRLLTQMAPAVAEAIRRFDRDVNAVLARGMMRMFAVAREAYLDALNGRGDLDFIEVLARALLLLRQMDEFAQSRYRLENRYQHVLVDEFQDTSRPQWELVSLLVQAWGEGQGLGADATVQPSIFLVGDRKQSIYRFRDADVSLLSEAGAFVERLRPGPSPRRVISRSFRAVAELQQFINDLFAVIGDEPVAARGDTFRFQAHDRFPVDLAPVGEARDVLGVIVADDQEACAGRVATEIRRLLAEASVRDRDTGIAREARPGDVAILFRSRDSHREFERALDAQGVPSYVYKGLGFFDADEVKDLVALMRYLANPASDLRAAAFLRSRIVRLSDPALGALAPRIAQALTSIDPPEISAWGEDDRSTLARVRSSLPAWLALVDRIPPGEVLDRVLADSAYAFEWRGARAAQARENVKKFRGLVRRIQNKGYATLGRIADHLHRLSVGDESNAVVDAVDAVNLMTVHAAKGLEFSIVFLVNLSRGTGGASPEIRMGLDRADGEPLVSIGGLAADLVDEEALADREETKRLLYVAATRARDRLYWCSAVSADAFEPGRGSLGEVLPPSFRTLLADAARASQDQDALEWHGPDRTYRLRLCRAQSEQTLPASANRVEDPPADFEPITLIDSDLPTTVTALVRLVKPDVAAPLTGEPRDVAARVGTLVHRLLRVAGRKAWDRQHLTRAAAGLLHDDDLCDTDGREQIVDRAIEAYETLRSRKDVASLLEGDCAFEVSFSMRVSEPPSAIVRGTIDCLVRRPDGRLTVIEIKTGGPRPEHQVQLAWYVRAARALCRGAQVEGSLIYV